MATYGLTPQGWVGKPASQVQSEIDTAMQGILGASAATEPDGTIPLRSLAGQEIVMWTDFLSAQWDLLQAIVSSFNPDQATGNLQDSLCALTGTVREPAINSSAVVTCCGTPTTVLSAGRVVTVTGTGTRFDSASQATITALTAWAQSTSYSAGQRVTANGKCFQCITSGTSSGVGTGPNSTSTNITDGTVHWEYIGTGTGAVDVAFQAEQPGALGADPLTLVNIATPVGGWTTATNLAAAAIGAVQETDAALRVRREAELAGEGRSPADAIRAAILKVNEASTDPNHLPILSCTVFHNDTDFTDGNGLPPHSVEVLALYSGLASATTDQDIADAVFANVAAGIAYHGNQTSTVVDSQGNPQTVLWSKPTAVPIFVVATVFYDPSKWPVSGAGPLVQQAAISALLTFGAAYPVGESVRASPLSAAIIDGPSALDSSGNAVFPAPAGSAPAPGILDVNPMFIGTAPAPGTSTPVAITARQIATFSAVDISITATPEAP